jgi:heat shock protein HtpX
LSWPAQRTRDHCLDTMPIRSDILEERHRENTQQTITIVAALGCLLVAMRWIIAGFSGVFLALGLLTLTVLLTPRIAPALIFRYDKEKEIDPRRSAGLYETVMALARRADLPTAPRLFYIPSPIHSAFATGSGEHAAIGITDGILRNFTPREVGGILAHEISHIKHRDTNVLALADTMNRLTAAASQMVLFLLLISIPLILFNGYSIAWIPLLLLLAAPSEANLLQLGLSRTREYAADLEAARLTGDPQGLASALRRLERLTPGRWEQVLLPGRRIPEPSLLRTHPPTEERIARLLELRQEDAEHLLLPSDWHPHPAHLPRQHPTIALAPRPTWHLSGLWY